MNRPRATEATQRKERNMSQKDLSTDESFEQKLSRLRVRIDSLPPQQRSHLHELADAISREHRQLQQPRRSPHDSH
jgi:hypothetical protein